MKQVFSLIFIITVVTGLQAQTVITGKVINNKNEPLTSASIRIKESGKGVKADSTGAFRLITSEKGKKVLLVSSIGYTSKELDLLLNDSAQYIKVVLEDEAKLLGDVIVLGAGTFEASDKAKGASLTPMDAVTVAGSGADIANSLRALPGVQQVGESEGLFVRGGTSDEAKQFIDGVLFPNANYAAIPGIMQPARVNPFLFKGILFNTGGYSSLYGDALSSALILETVDLPDKSEASLHLFPTSQGLGFQQVDKNKQRSAGATASYSNASLYNKVVSQKAAYFHGPEYISGDFNFRIKTSKTGILKFYTNYGYNNVGLHTPDIDSSNLLSAFQVKGNNVYSNLSYKESLNNNWKIETALSHNYNKENIQTALLTNEKEKLYLPYSPFREKNDSITNESNFINGKLVFSKRLARRQAFRFGSEYINNTARQSTDSAKSSYTENAVALFAEGDVYISKAIAARIGLRSEYSGLLNRFNLAPRISLAYKIGNGSQLNMAYGIFYQKPAGSFLLQNENLAFTQATHYIINYQVKASNRLLRAEIFYKTYKNLVSTDPLTGNNGDGYAKGFELFFRDKKTIKDLDYWISYSYLDTKRKYLDYPYQLSPSYTTPHTFSLAVKKFFPELKFSANMAYAFATGRPYYDMRTGSDGKVAIYGKGTTNSYHNINVSFAYLFSLFKKWNDFSGIGFGMNNVLGSNQVFGYNYSYNGNNKAPVTLPATRFYYIGIFMSFGTDRRDDFINQNL
ncbi:MAG TPA: TonB-dependent receptor [Chitinophagaceae bacterium]|nr:TonB-dependent receptor [Chitinophagaceae bacterium]